MAQGLVVVRNEDIPYKEMRAIAVDVMTYCRDAFKKTLMITLLCVTL